MIVYNSMYIIHLPKTTKLQDCWVLQEDCNVLCFGHLENPLKKALRPFRWLKSQESASKRQVRLCPWIVSLVRYEKVSSFKRLPLDTGVDMGIHQDDWNFMSEPPEGTNLNGSLSWTWPCKAVEQAGLQQLLGVPFLWRGSPSRGHLKIFSGYLLPPVLPVSKRRLLFVVEGKGCNTLLCQPKNVLWMTIFRESSLIARSSSKQRSQRNKNAASKQELMFRGVHHIVLHIYLSNLEAWKAVLRLSFWAGNMSRDQHMSIQENFPELVQVMKPRNSSIWYVQ